MEIRKNMIAVCPECDCYVELIESENVYYCDHCGRDFSYNEICWENLQDYDNTHGTAFSYWDWFNNHK